MNSHDIRSRFLDFFKKNGHTIVPSSSTVPHEDPTLLFTNAGMNQFKDVFLGESKRDYVRATSSQKCIRVGGKHNDLDNVGHTTRHVTFFEMLGNFSFGDYFKKEAIAFAWEVTMQVFAYPEEKIWVSVYEKDDESYELWKAHLPEKRIVRMGEEENYWSMGEVGPCGPCSELLFDRGAAFGSGTNPLEDPSGERFPEFWNLVFMQYNRDKAGKMTELPNKSIDTGAGLERILLFNSDKQSVFETDILRELIASVEQISGKSYNPKDAHTAPAFHVIADHIRSLSFAIADGAEPSNVERGYVLRKILRRAVRYGKVLGLNEPFLAKVFPRLLEQMGNDFPELNSAKNRIPEILSREEEGFFRTLKRGGNILNTVIKKAEKDPKRHITGEDAFKLKDTYGFPLEEVLLIAKDMDLTVNLEEYSLLEERAKELSRSAKKTAAKELRSNLFTDYEPTEFVGFEEESCETTILAMVRDGEFVEKLESGEKAAILLSKTPFYAEKGGQVGDHGELIHKEAHFRVDDTQSPFPGIVLHEGVVTKGILIGGEPVQAVIDAKRRKKIAAHHTATHLLHWALAEVLGDHIKQSGSVVEVDRLRFDFSHHKALTREEIREIEMLVNRQIRTDHIVKTYELSYEDVQKRSDIKQFFGEKYGDKVRVVDIEFSKELCGGTHVDHIGGIGLFRITKESSIAAGVRRIEASCGELAEEFMYKSENALTSLSTLLQTKEEKLQDRLQNILEENRENKAKLKAMRAIYLHDHASHLMQSAEQIKDVPTLIASVDVEPNELGPLGNDLLSRLKSGIILLALPLDGRCQLLIKVSDEYIKKGFEAGKLIKEIAPLVGGSGGGKKDSAQAGGKHPEKILEAFEKLRNLIIESC